VFFTTSNVGGKAPDSLPGRPRSRMRRNIDELKSLDIIISCQGGDYTNEVFPRLRAAGWKGTGSMRRRACA
jgi:aspartate-semialdehyde dehydrogenase